VDVPNNGTCTLTPGLYVVNGTWKLGNNSLLKGTNVTLYVPASGYLDFKNGNVQLKSGASGLEDYAIIYARDNTNMLSLQGNGNSFIDGVVYTPASLLDFNGTSDFVFRGGPVVANGVEMANGNHSTVKIEAAKATGVAKKPTHLSR
jgi:hypothetical protein